MSELLGPASSNSKIRNDVKHSKKKVKPKNEKQSQDEEEFRITLEGWTQDDEEEDEHKPEEFIEKPKVKKGSYKKACQNALNNLSQGIFSPKENKRTPPTAEKSIIEGSEYNSESPRHQEDRKSDEIIQSPRAEFEDKIVMLTQKSVEKHEEETERSSVNPKFNWSNFGNEEASVNAQTIFEGGKPEVDHSANTTIKVPEKSFDSLNATKSTTDKPSWPIRGAHRLEKLNKIDDRSQERERDNSLTVSPSKHTIDVHFEKPQNSQLALIEKFQYLNKINYKVSNLMKPIHKRKPSLSPLEVGELPRISDSIHKLNSNTPQVTLMHPTLSKKSGKGLSCVSTNKTLSFEHNPKKIQAHETLRNLLDDLPSSSVLTKKRLGIHRDSEHHSSYVNKTILDDSQRSKPINPLNMFKVPLDLRPKNLSPFPSIAMNINGNANTSVNMPNINRPPQLNMKPVTQLVQTYENIKKDFPSNRRGKSTGIDEMGELVQYIFSNTPNKSSMMEKYSASPSGTGQKVTRTEWTSPSPILAKISARGRPKFS